MKMRRFEKVSSEVFDGEVNIPKRSTEQSAGYDIESAEDVKINPHEQAIVSTGLKARMLPDEVLMIFIRSSMAIKKGLSIVNGTGIIDADYYNNIQNEGHILVCLQNNRDTPYEVKEGERVAQGIFLKYLVPDNDAESPMCKRSGGIGSTNVRG